jgi:hypothetical protein
MMQLIISNENGGLLVIYKMNHTKRCCIRTPTMTMKCVEEEEGLMAFRKAMFSLKWLFEILILSVLFF